MIEISKTDSFEELLKIEKEWTELAEKSNPDNIFISFEWISEWWKHFGKNKELFVLLAKDNEKLVGIAPLMLSPAKILGVSLKKLEFIGMPLSDYCDFIIDDKLDLVLKKFYDFIFENSKLWSFVNLNRLSESSPIIRLSNQILGSRKLHTSMQTDICPCHVFDRQSIEFGKSINNRGMRKGLTQLRKRGNLEFLTLEKEKDSRKILQLLNVFFEQHRKRWNNTATPSIFNDETNKSFFSSIFTTLLYRKKADLYCLKLNDVPIAFQFVFLGDKKLMDYVVSYDVDYAKHSPGILILKFIWEKCASRDYEELDMMRGNEKYKLKFANRIKKSYKFIIHKNFVLYSFDFFFSKLEFKIKNNEKLYNFFIKYEKKLRFF